MVRQISRKKRDSPMARYAWDSERMAGRGVRVVGEEWEWRG